MVLFLLTVYLAEYLLLLRTYIVVNPALQVARRTLMFVVLWIVLVENGAHDANHHRRYEHRSNSGRSSLLPESLPE